MQCRLLAARLNRLTQQTRRDSLLQFHANLMQNDALFLLAFAPAFVPLAYLLLTGIHMPLTGKGYNLLALRRWLERYPLCLCGAMLAPQMTVRFHGERAAVLVA